MILKKFNMKRVTRLLKSLLVSKTPIPIVYSRILFTAPMRRFPFMSCAFAVQHKYRMTDDTIIFSATYKNIAKFKKAIGDVS